MLSLKLLAEVLKYYKVSDHIITLITSLYADYFISVATDNYLTSKVYNRYFWDSLFTCNVSIYKKDTYKTLKFLTIPRNISMTSIHTKK